ncbi:AI-2E family transporter [Ornithinimicrobium cerasi]|nr:AI-2E family transporter [Ornithinimicrobium cerasi]
MTGGILRRGRRGGPGGRPGRGGALSRLRPHHLPRAGRRAMRSWQDYRERQLALLEENNPGATLLGPHEVVQRVERVRGEQGRTSPSATAPGVVAAEASAELPVGARGADAAHEPARGWPFASPFYLGFTLALGALVAWLLVQNLTRLTSVFTFLLVSLFVTLALDPVVQWLTRRGLGRGAAVSLVFLGLVGAITVVGLLVVPPTVAQATVLTERAPGYVRDLLSSPWLNDLDARYDLSDRLTAEFERLAMDRSTISTVFGGVLGAAGWVAGNLIGLLTSIILTLYLLATLPTVKEAAYLLVAQSRRPRVRALAEEIMRRVGGYALGQTAVATVNALCSWVMMQILGIPYSAMLAVLVGLLGLIPMIGATLGAVIVALAALTVSPTATLAVIIYYIVYQQFENYVIVPHVMRRTVAVPGAVTVVAVLVGGTLLGVLGALIAIPVAAGLLLIYHQVLVPRQDSL